MTDTGYSGTPLGKKLGYLEGMRVFVDGMPDLIRHAVERSVDAKPDWQFVPEPDLVRLEAHKAPHLNLLANSSHYRL